MVNHESPVRRSLDQYFGETSEGSTEPTLPRSAKFRVSLRIRTAPGRVNARRTSE
jgi:hypothetical protein